MEQPVKANVEPANAYWARIASNPKFKDLHRKKVKFLFGWWIFSTVIYIVFLASANLAGNLFGWRIIGDINFGYLAVLTLFVYCWFIAGFYAAWANKVADKITEELIGELKKGGLQ